MKRILILTASFGDGHNAAARNLRDAIELITDDAKVEVLDLFESTYGTLNTLLKQTYQGLVRYAPERVVGRVFHVRQSRAVPPPNGHDGQARASRWPLSCTRPSRTSWSPPTRFTRT